MPYLASFFDAMSGVNKLSNFMHFINYPTSAFEPYKFEGPFAKVVQIIGGLKFVSFLTPDMVSKNYAIHGIGLS